MSGASALAQPGTILLFGEIHGSIEAPQFVENVVCLALQAGQSVAVGLEIPAEFQETFSAFLASEGSTEDRDLLLAGEFWQSAFKDGRSSKAVLDLLENVRVRVRDGQPVSLILLDTISGNDRDRAMAEQLKIAVEKHPKYFFVALTGNLHNRARLGFPWDPDHEPMGYLLTHSLADHRVLSLAMSYPDGTAWFCTDGAESCGAHSITGSPSENSSEIRLFDELDENGYHGSFRVSSMTASPPAAPSGPKDNQ